jgi:hypothetical protein
MNASWGAWRFERISSGGAGVRLVAQVREVFGIELPVRAPFEAQSIRPLGKREEHALGKVCVGLQFDSNYTEADLKEGIL